MALINGCAVTVGDGDRAQMILVAASISAMQESVTFLEMDI